MALTSSKNPLDLSQAFSGFSGNLIFPGGAEYDAARAIFNAMIDKRPAVIAQCRDSRDVQMAVAAATAHNLPLSVRGGGHNVAGNAVCDDGVMIDLSAMRRVSVDPGKRLARAQGGATWSDFDAATQAHGLATTGGAISSTGIAGLTLGGGIGWLQRKFGLTCDNLVSAEVVTADGRIVTASAVENPDLFWGLRGGGGNFGVVTSFEYALHPLGPIYGGMVIHPFPRALEVLRFYKEFSAGLPDEATLNAVLLTGPDGRPAVAMAGCHCGTPEQAARDMQPLKDFGPPVADHFGPMPYLALQSMIDQAFAKGHRNYWKSDLLNGIEDALFERLIADFAKVPSPRSAILIEQFGGASSRIAEADTAVAIRGAPYNLLILSMWDHAAGDEANRNWARGVFDAVKPFSAGKAYVNYLGTEDDDGVVRIEAAYGRQKLARLRSLKAKYDPANRFSYNQNIKPA